MKRREIGEKGLSHDKGNIAGGEMGNWIKKN